MNDDKTQVAGCMFAVVIFPAIVAWQAFCLMNLWAWFAPAPFAHLTYSASVGLLVLFALIIKPNVPVNPKKSDEPLPKLLGDFIGNQALLPGFLFLMGYVVHLLAGAP